MCTLKSIFCISDADLIQYQNEFLSKKSIYRTSQKLNRYIIFDHSVLVLIYSTVVSLIRNVIYICHLKYIPTVDMLVVLVDMLFFDICNVLMISNLHII